MTRRFTLSTLLLSLTLTSVSVPAQAQDGSEALARFLGAAATIIILGSVLDGGNDTPQAEAAPRRRTPEVAPRRAPAVVQAAPRPIPSQCLRRVNGGNTRFAVATPCLTRNDYRGLRRMPQACRLDIRTNKRLVPGYSMRCLRNRGYRTTAQ